MVCFINVWCLGDYILFGKYIYMLFIIVRNNGCFFLFIYNVDMVECLYVCIYLSSYMLL